MHRVKESNSGLFAGLALFRAILNVFPITSPLLTPLKGQIASLTDLWCEAVFCFCFHKIKITGVVAKLLCVRKIKVALRDKAQGHLVCAPLTGFEPATLPLVRGMLYPMSYSGTQLGM